MCGIVGLFPKDSALEPKLGAMLPEMLNTMCDRGPDSAGFAIHSPAKRGQVKDHLAVASAADAFDQLAKAVGEAIGASVTLEGKSTHAVPGEKGGSSARGGARSRIQHPHHGQRRGHRNLQGGRASG